MACQYHKHAMVPLVVTNAPLIALQAQEVEALMASLQRWFALLQEPLFNNT